MNNKNETLNVDTTEIQSWEKSFDNERTIAPLVDIYETTEDYILLANLPGVTKDNVKLKLEEGTLVIFGKLNYASDLTKKYLLKENETGHFYRRFRISDSIDETKVEAFYSDGQLKVKLPKHDRIKPRTINIK